MSSHDSANSFRAGMLLLSAAILTWPVTAALAQTYVEPPFAGTVAVPQTIEPSMYYSDPQAPADPTRLELTMDDGSGNVVKTSPYWPQAFLQNPEGIPLDWTFIKTCDLRDIDPNLDPDGCQSFDLDGDEIADVTNCPRRYIYLVNGFLASITVETNNPRRLDPDLLFIDDPNGPVDPPPEPPLVVIATPASEGSPYLPRITENDDPCAHQLLGLWQHNTAIWNTVNLHGVAIAILDPWTGGNRALNDVMAYYVAARLARSWFAVDGEGPILYGHGGSWGGGTSMFAATLHPHIYGAFTLAGIFEGDEFANHVDNSIKRHGTLGLGKVTNWDGPNTGRHLGLNVLARNLVPLGAESLMQWLSPMHQTERLDDVLYWGYGGGDFSTDPYGPNLSQLQAKLAALGKDHLFLPDVRDFAGHGFGLSPDELYPFLKALYWHWLDVKVRGPIVVPPFSSDGYTAGENPLYLDNLHLVPDRARSGSDPGLISAITASNEGGVMLPGRLDAIAFLSHEGSDYFVMSAGDGRLRLYQIDPSGTVTLVHTTESQGWGAAGLLVDGDRILSTSAKGNFRAWGISGSGPSAVLTSVFEHDTRDGRRFGDFPRILKTALPFFAGEAIFAYAYAPYLGQEPFANVTVVDATDYASFMQFDCDPISFALPVLDDQERATIFLATPRGYGGTLDLDAPWVTDGGKAKLKFDQISGFLNMQVRGGVQRSLNGSRYLVLAGHGAQQMVVLDDQLRIVSSWSDPEQADPEALVPSATDATFYARHHDDVSRFELREVGGTPTVARLTLAVFSAPRGIEGFGASPWMGETLFVAGGVDSFQVVSVDAGGTPTVRHDTYGTNESHDQALDCSSGTCFVLNRDDGKIYRLENDMRRGSQVAQRQLADGTTPFNFLLVDDKSAPPITQTDYYPTIYKSSRRFDFDTATFGDEIAYNNAGFIEVYDMQPGGCLFDEPGACEPTFASSERMVIGGGSMDHNVKFYQIEGEKTIVVTGATGFIGVLKKGPSAFVYQPVFHQNLLGRFCHAMDVRVENGEEIIYTGCDTEGEYGGALNRWHLDCSTVPCSLVRQWSEYRGSAPTAIRWIPGDPGGCPGDRLVFADFAGSLHVLDGDGAAGPGTLLVKSESLEGGGPGAVSGLFPSRTVNGDLVDDRLRFSTPAQRYAVTLTTNCN